MLLEAELKGIKIDLNELGIKQASNTLHAECLKKELEKMWTKEIKLYHHNERRRITKHYRELYKKAITKTSNQNLCLTRYQSLLKKAINRIEPFNIDSPSQLNWLFKYKGYNTINMDGKDSTGREILESLSKENLPDIDLLLEYKKYKKLCTAFFPSYKDMQYNSCIHGTFNPTGTRTGRLSSSEPNLQQIPSDLHSLYVARPDHKLITYDFAAIEPRIIAYLTEDPVLYEIFNQSLDFHGLNTKIFFGLDCDISEVKEKYPKERKVGKEVGLALFYGAGARRLQQSAQKHGFVWSLEDCQQRCRKFRETYKQVFDYKRELDKTLEHSYVTNILGRPIYIERIENIYMTGFNTLIQSSASDLLLEAAYKAWQHFDNCHPLLFVHDEVVFECPSIKANEYAELLADYMRSFKMPTQHGNIEIAVEGGLNDAWIK
jgi:DNA polymerase-1